LVEQLIRNQQVVGSNPTGGSKKSSKFKESWVHRDGHSVELSPIVRKLSEFVKGRKRAERDCAVEPNAFYQGLNAARPGASGVIGSSDAPVKSSSQTDRSSPRSGALRRLYLWKRAMLQNASRKIVR
jgi:hypothetical protein